MTAAAHVKTLLKRFLPRPISKGLARVYNKFKPLSINQPVTVYRNDDRASTVIGINNYYSWILAGVPVKVKVRVDFYDPAGKRVLRHTVTLGEFASAGVDVRKVFAANNISSEYGIFSVGIYPNASWRDEFRHMGNFTGVYFALFQYNDGSVGVVHPNSRLGDEQVEKRTWYSLQLIHTKGLNEVNLYHMHPADVTMDQTFILYCPKTNREFGRASIAMTPRSAHRIHFDLTNARDLPEFLQLRSTEMSPNNAKALLERVFASGNSSISHS